MKTLGLIVVVHVTDLEASMNYYINVLGFTPDFTFGDYAGLVYDKIMIHLNGSTYQGQKKPAGSAHFYIDCDEIDEYFALIKSKGALIEVPPGDRTYGMRDCTIYDPDGNTIVFGKAI